MGQSDSSSVSEVVVGSPRRRRKRRRSVHAGQRREDLRLRFEAEEKARLEADEVYLTDDWPQWLASHPYPSVADTLAQPKKKVRCQSPWPDGLKSPFTFQWRLMVRPDRFALLPSTDLVRGWSELCVVVPRVHAALGGASVWFEGKELPCYFHDDSFLFLLRNPGDYTFRNLRKRGDTFVRLERKRTLSPVLRYGGPVEWSGVYGDLVERRYFRLTGIEDHGTEITDLPRVIL